jgi:hypothetical protein
MVLKEEPRRTLKQASPSVTYFTTERLWNVVGLNQVLCSDDLAPKRLNHGAVTNHSAESDAVRPDPIMETGCSVETSLYIRNTRRYRKNKSSDFLENISCLYSLLQGGAKISWYSVFKMFCLMPRVFFCDTRYSMEDESSRLELFAIVT